MSVPAESPRLINARKFFMSLAASQLEEAAHLLSPNITYTVPAGNALSGVFRGPAEVKRHLIELFEFSHETYDALKFADWMVGDSHVAMLQDAQLQGNGKIYRGHQLFLVTFDQNDALSRIEVFFENQEAANRFFSG
jgi:ketosteroid isomerase-like protein